MDAYRYALRRTEYACEDVISLDQAKRNCAIDGDEHDDTLVELIHQALDHVEERTDCSLTTTTWEMTFDAFPRAKSLDLPRWPLQSVESVTYVDAAGELQTIDTAKFVVRKDDYGRGRLALKGWESWPTTQCTPDAVTIAFKAGWEESAHVPPQWSRALLMLVAWWFEQREAGVIGVQASTVPLGIDALLDSAATADDFDEFDLD